MRVIRVHLLEPERRGLESPESHGYVEEGISEISPGSVRKGEGNNNPLQYSCLENPMDRGAW